MFKLKKPLTIDFTSQGNVVFASFFHLWKGCNCEVTNDVPLFSLDLHFILLMEWLCLQEEYFTRNKRHEESQQNITGLNFTSFYFILLHFTCDTSRRSMRNQYLFVFAAGCPGIFSLSPESVFCDIMGSIHSCLLEVPSERSSLTDNNL